MVPLFGVGYRPTEPSDFMAIIHEKKTARRDCVLPQIGRGAEALSLEVTGMRWQQVAEIGSRLKQILMILKDHHVYVLL